MPQPTIDSHHHLWDYNPSQYGWIDPATMGVLAHDYTFDDLCDAAGPCGLVGTVAVQAQQTLAETDQLLDIAQSNEQCLGVVGWAPLRDPEIGSVLERYRDTPNLKGLRHVVQDEPDGFMLDPAFQHGVSLLQDAGLVYDILIFGRQLREAIQLVDRFPQQPFVLDHAAKPTIRADHFDQDWANQIARLAKRPNVVCKLSGLVTEVRDPTWDVQLLRPYIELVVEAFGIDRVLFGSDWPVCLLKSSYLDWHTAVETIASGFSPPERQRFFHDNTVAAYCLDTPDAPCSA
ncbi:amidohydrolase family protein [Phycisphaeraceae bacterium D3-23]